MYNRTLCKSIPIGLKCTNQAEFVIIDTTTQLWNSTTEKKNGDPCFARWFSRYTKTNDELSRVLAVATPTLQGFLRSYCTYPSLPKLCLAVYCSCRGGVRLLILNMVVWRFLGLSPKVVYCTLYVHFNYQHDYLALNNKNFLRKAN